MKKKTAAFCLLAAILCLIFVGCDEATSLSFTEERFVVGVGKEITPEVSVFPSSAAYELSVSNTTIAEVNGHTVKGLKTGVTVITATSGGRTASAELVVSDATLPGDTGDIADYSTYYVTFRIVNPELVGLSDDLIATTAYSQGDYVTQSLPEYLGYTVYGWFTDYSCENTFDASKTKVTEDLVLFCFASRLENSFLADSDGKLTGLVFKNLPHDTLVLPDSINGIPITGVAANAFSGDVLLKNVTIPASYLTIGDFAFAGCTSLVSVEFERGSVLESIGKFAFGVTAEESADGSELVSGDNPCAALKEINLPQTVSSIGAFAFGYCTSLELSGIPSSLTKIEYGAFKGTKITDVDLANVTEIQAYAFLDCASLLTVRDSENVVACGVDAFKNTALYKTQINVSPYVVYVDTMAVDCNSYYGALNGGKLELPNRITLIADGAFNGSNQSELTVYFPKAGILIGDEAFLDEDGVCLVVNDDETCASYKEAVSKNDNAAYAKRFCVKKEILVDDENAVNFGKHTLLKFSETEYYYDKFTVMKNSAGKAKSPTVISLADLTYGDYITRINTRAINLGEGGGNLVTLVMPKNLKSVAILSVINCGVLETIDMTRCNTVPDIVQNSFQFDSLGDKTTPKTETKILVKSADYSAFRNKWEGKGTAYARLTKAE